jgi:sugar-phosphatase
VRAEVEPIVAAAGLDDVLSTLVTADDVEHGKPHPEGYLRALELVGDGAEPADVAVFEDTEAGIASAKSAGTYVLGVLGTLAPERLATADELVPAVDVDVMRRLLG